MVKAKARTMFIGADLATQFETIYSSRLPKSADNVRCTS